MPLVTNTDCIVLVTSCTKDPFWLSLLPGSELYKPCICSALVQLPPACVDGSMIEKYYKRGGKQNIFVLPVTNSCIWNTSKYCLCTFYIINKSLNKENIFFLFSFYFLSAQHKGVFCIFKILAFRWLKSTLINCHFMSFARKTLAVQVSFSLFRACLGWQG